MKRLITFSLEQGGHHLPVEVEVDRMVGMGPDAEPPEPVEKVSGSFETAVAHIKPAVSSLMSQLAGTADNLEKVELEFGVRFTARAGAIIASTAVDANFRVRLTWRPK